MHGTAVHAKDECVRTGQTWLRHPHQRGAERELFVHPATVPRRSKPWLSRWIPQPRTCAVDPTSVTRMLVSMPERIQLRRTKGWRIPANTVNCARPGWWGNPHPVQEYGLEVSLALSRMNPPSRAYDSSTTGKNRALGVQLS